MSRIHVRTAARTAIGATVIVVCTACGGGAFPTSPAPTATATTTAGPPSVSPSATVATAVPSPQATVSVGTSGVPRGAGPGVTQVNGADASAVGAAFATASFTFDTAIDASPADAQRRSAEFATPSFAAELRQPLALSGGDRFATLIDHHGYVTVAMTENRDDGRPPDTATTAVRAWTVTSTGHSPDGWMAPMGDVVIYVSMTRAAPTSPWQISSLMIQQAN